MNGNENTSSVRMEPIRIRTTLLAGPNRRMVARVRDHEILMDVSKERGGEDAGPTPPECLAMALGGCVLNICRVLAMQKGIVLDGLRISVSGDIDPTKAFGIPTDTRAGFSNLSVRVEAASKLTDAERENLRLELIERCPLCDTIAGPTPLQITFVK
jgi:putative redox protein